MQEIKYSIRSKIWTYQIKNVTVLAERTEQKSHKAGGLMAQTWDTDGLPSLTGPGEYSAPGIACQQSRMAPTQERVRLKCENLWNQKIYIL